MKHRIENVRTVNSWGFDGIIGKGFHYIDGFSKLVATRYYRHRPSTPYRIYWGPNQVPITKAEFDSRSIIDHLSTPKDPEDYI